MSTIEEVKLQKKATEDLFARLLSDFEISCGVKVTSIDISRLRVKTIDGKVTDIIDSIELEIKL